MRISEYHVEPVGLTNVSRALYSFPRQYKNKHDDRGNVLN
jgi:hypothetical protein